MIDDIRAGFHPKLNANGHPDESNADFFQHSQLLINYLFESVRK